MFKNLLQLYALLSCLIYGIATFVGLANFSDRTISYFFPELEGVPAYLSSEQGYRAEKKEFKTAPQEEIEQQRLRELEAWTKDIKMRHLRQMVHWLPWLALSLLLLLIHVVVYKKSKKDMSV